ncbi:hypothetical protein D3C75_624520 [compost metagenome]
MHHLPRHGDLGGHVRQAEGHGLVLDDRLAEALALTGVIARRFERGTGHAHRLRSDADAAAFKVGQGNPVAFALLAQTIGQRHLHVFEEDLAGVGRMLAELVFDPRDFVARRIGRHYKGADATFAGTRIGHRKHDHHPGILPGGDELLAAVEHIMIAFQARTGFQAAGVGTGLGLGQRKGTEHRTAGQRFEEALFLLIGAVVEDRYATHGVVHAHDGRAGAIAGGDFFQRHGVGQVTGVASAPLLRHQHAEEAQPGHFADGFLGKTVLAVPLGSEGLQPFLGKVPGHVADLLLVVIGDHGESLNLVTT